MQDLGCLDERMRYVAADVDGLSAVDPRCKPGSQQRLDAVVHVDEVAQGVASAHERNLLALHGQAHEPIEDTVVRVLHLRARPVDVGQPQQHGRDPVGRRIDLDHLLGSVIRQLVDSLWIRRRFLVHR